MARDRCVKTIGWNMESSLVGGQPSLPGNWKGYCAIENAGLVSYCLGKRRRRTRDVRDLGVGFRWVR